MTDTVTGELASDAEVAAVALAAAALAASMSATIAAIQRGEADWRVGRLVNAELARVAVRTRVLTRAEAAAALGCGVTAMYARWREHDATVAATMQWQQDVGLVELAPHMAPVVPPG